MPPDNDGARKHTTRSDTAKAGYDKLRSAGASHEFARARAEKASELTHRSQDNINSDANPRRKDR
jgi:hypothetical protein